MARIHMAFTWPIAASVVVGLALVAASLVSLPAPHSTGPQQATERAHDGDRVPYPGSLLPEQVVANVKAVVARTTLAEGLHLPELAMRHDELHANRILQVRSELNTLSGWLVVELKNTKGADIANVASGGSVCG